MSFWSKAKGVFSRIGRGIKNVATKGFNIAKGIVNKFGAPIGAAISTAFTGDPTIGAKIGGAASKLAGYIPNL